MSRKTSIDRLLNVNAKLRIPELRSAFADRHIPEADDVLYANIKSVLENLRTVLDYTFKDLADVTPTVSSPGHGDKLYFPFVHPLSRKGKPKTVTEIQNDFSKKPLVREIKKSHRAIYDVIESIQGELWLSELIEKVNPMKHDDVVKLGESELRLSPGPGAPTLTLKNRAKIVASNQGKLTIVFGKNPVTFDGPLKVGSPIPPALRPYARVVEGIEPATVEGWITRLSDWNSRVIGLLDRIYEHYPR